MQFFFSDLNSNNCHRFIYNGIQVKTVCICFKFHVKLDHWSHYDQIFNINNR